MRRMFIFNTTFHVEEGAKEQFVQFLKAEYIPLAMEQELLCNPRLARIFGAQYDKGDSFALQFDVENPDVLEQWNRAVGKRVNDLLLTHFKENVAGFVTVLQKIDVTK